MNDKWRSGFRRQLPARQKFDVESVLGPRQVLGIHYSSFLIDYPTSRVEVALAIFHPWGYNGTGWAAISMRTKP
jgi:hypothetical protein